MKVKITADSTCDLSSDLLRQCDITLFPMTVVTYGQPHLDGVDITEQDLYDYAAATGRLATTSAANAYEYGTFFDRELEGYDALIHISLSSGISSCTRNAGLAAAERKNVYVVDSRNLSTGSGHLVLDAAGLAADGVEAPEIVERLNRTAPLVEASFVIDTLEYLHKGGRCSTLALLGANVLNFKPCIEVSDGVMSVGKKYRGAYMNVIRKYVRDRLCNRTDIDLSRIFITHTRTPEEICLAVREEVMSVCDFQQIIETEAGPTIACHCGPCTLGILFKRKPE